MPRKATSLFAHVWFALILAFTTTHADAQQKYYQVNVQKNKDPYSKGILATASLNIVAPQRNNDAIVFDYPGKSSRELFTAVLKYVRSIPQFLIMETDSSSFIRYRDFSYIGKKDSCYADLVSVTYVTVYVRDSRVDFYLRYNIYASITGADFRISKFEEISSQNDVAFNEYRMVQPAPYKDGDVYKSGGLIGLVTKKRGEKHMPGLAYPDSIYDSEGNLVNAKNKQIIENFYDNFPAGLKYALDNNN